MGHTHKLTDEERFCLEGCRNYKQYYQMRQGFEGRICVFCQIDRHLNQILWESTDVMLWKVPEQYLRTTLSLHVLIVPKRHVRFEADLTDAEVISVHRAKQHVRQNLGYQGGLSHVREGDMRLNAGTVPHLHYNLFEPNQRGEVQVPVCKNPCDQEANTDRTLKFAAQYESGMTP